jgi:Zn-finger nucleic acid-binding protein
MAPRAVGGIAVSECGSCQGLWIPEGLLERLVERARDARCGADPARPPAPPPRLRGGNPAAQRVAYRRCPECDAFMQRRNFRRRSGVIVDVCGRHGTWVDAGELERIAGFLLGPGPDAALVAGAEAVPAPPAGPTPADALFARILAEHGARPRPEPAQGSRSVLDVLVGLLR